MLILPIYAIIICFASIVGVVTGFGFSTLAIPVLSITTSMPMVEILFLVAAMHITLNAYKVLFFHGGWNQITLFFIIIGGISSLVGAWVALYIFQEQWRLLLGLFLLLYAVFSLFLQPPVIPENRFTAFAGATLSGFFAGLLGIGGAVRSVFLDVYNLPKEAYIATTGVIALAIDIARLSVYQTKVVHVQELWQFFLVSIPVQLLGVLIGRRLVTYVPQHHYRHVVSFALGLFGLWLLFGNGFQ